MLKKVQSNRRNMRESAFRIVYASLFTEQTDKFREEMYKLMNLPESCYADADKLIYATLDNMQELSEILSKYCTRQSVENLFYVDKAFLFLAIAEMKYIQDTPNIIVIDEIVSIAKKYATEYGLSFINGVLAAYIKDLELGSYIADILENIEE